MLTAKEKGRLLRGEWPTLVRPIIAGEDPPFKAGEEFVLRRVGEAPQMAITITGTKRDKRGHWRVEYSLRDDRPLFLKRGADLTRNRDQAIDDAEVLDPETLKAFSVRSRAAAAERDRERRSSSAEARRRQERGIRDRLRQTLAGLEPLAADALLAEIQTVIENAD